MSTAACETAAAADVRHPIPRATWWTLAALAGGHFAVDCCTGIWPVFKTLAGLDIATAGLIHTVGNMAGNGSQLAFGMLADRGWRKRLIVLGVAGSSAVMLLPFAVHSYLLMGALVLLTQVSSAAFHPSATGAAGALSRRRTGFMIAALLAGGYAGYSVSQIVFSAAYNVLPALTVVLALLPLGIATALAGTVVERGPSGRRAAMSWTAARPELPRLLPLFSVQTIVSAVNVSLIFLLPDLLASRQAPTWIVQGGGHFALVAGGCLSLLPAGQASDRWGARGVLVIANVASFALLAALLARTRAGWPEILIVTAIGAFNGMSNVVAVAEGNRVFPGQASAVSALLMGMPWCVAATGPALAGVLADPTRGGTPASALAWYLVLAPLGLAAALLVPRRAAARSAHAV